MSAELIRRNTQTSRLEYLFNLLQDGNNDIGTLQEDDISTPQEDDNNEYDTAAAGGTSGVITVQQQTTTAKDSIEKNSDELDHDEDEDAELRRQWDELLKLSVGFLKCEVRSYGDLELIDLAKLAIDYEVPRDHNSDDMYHYRPFIIECLENRYCENRANICVDLLNDENEVHRKLIPRVIGKSSKDGDLLSVFYSLRSTLGCINSIYRVPPQRTREDVDTSIETSVTDVLSTPASDIDSREEEGTNDLQVSGDTSFEDEIIDDVVNNGRGDNINVSIESTAPSSLEGGGDNVMGIDVDFTNSGGDIDMMDVNALDASKHLVGKAMEVEGPPVETVDTTAVEACNNIDAADIASSTTTNEAGLNNHLYPALDAEESDAVGADSDVDMGMDSVNDEETDVVVSDSVSRSWVIKGKALGKRKSVNNLVKENAEKRACIVVPPSYQQHPQQKQVQVAVPPGIEVSLIDSSILNKKNNDLFKHKTLHNLTIILPSDVDEKELGISFDQNVRFGRVGVCGVSNSSSLFDQIPPMYHKGWLLLAIENNNEILELERCSDAINEMNNARRGKQATISLILAEPYINTLEEALAKWKELVDKKDFSTATEIEKQVFALVAAVFTDYIDHVYNNKDTPDNKLYFFKDLTPFPSFEEAKQDASGGGTYIGQASSRIPLKFGTSLTCCDNRKKKQGLKRAHLFCTLKKAQKMIPPRFLNRLIALNILNFDPSQIDTALQYCATLLNEATLTVIQPSITSNVGDLLLHSISNDVRLIIDPPIAQSVYNKLKVGGHAKPGDQVRAVTSWATFPSNMKSFRDGTLDLPALLELANDANDALLQHHLPEKDSDDFLTLFLYKNMLGEAFHGFTDCVEISPWMIRSIKVVKKMVAVMEEGDVLARYEEDGTIDDETKSKLEECLADMIEFAKVNKEYEPASLDEIAAGCKKVLQMLVKSLPLNVLICIETSTYQALIDIEEEFYYEFFEGYDEVEVLADNRLKFRKHQTEEKHRFIVVNTPFIAYTIADKATLAGRGTSIQSQNALIKVLMELGVVDKEKGEQVLARNRSFYNYLVWGGKDGKAGEGRIKLAIQLHLPPGMCQGNIPPGFKCLQHLLHLPFRTLLLFRLMMGSLKLKLVLDARGGKIGPTGCLPIEVDGQTCKGTLAIGRFAVTPCTCTPGTDCAAISMFMASNPSNLLHGHLLCRYCSNTSTRRLKVITAEALALGIDIERIIKIQPQISAVCNAFATNLALQRLTLSQSNTAVTTHVMNQVGFLQSDVEDTNLVKLVTEWVQLLLKASGVKTITKTKPRETTAHAPLQAKKAKKMGKPQQRLLWKFIETCPVQHTLVWYNKAREVMNMDPWYGILSAHPVAKYLSRTPTNPFSNATVVPNANDILPSNNIQWPGNIHFQRIIDGLKPIYQSKQSQEQSEMVDMVLSTLKFQGRRLLTHIGRWTELDADAAKERCIQALKG